MRIETGSRALSTDDLATLRRVLAPLRQWLQQSHGQRGRRDGALGMIGAAVGLVGLYVFDVSPLVAMLYIILAPATEAISAQLAQRHTAAEAARPFASPLHALAFIEAVIAAFRAQSVGEPLVAARSLPYAGVPAAATNAGAPDAPRFASRPPLPPIRGFLIYVACVMAMFIAPLAQAVSTIFNRWDWFALAAFAAINAAQMRSAWRDAHRAQRDPSWDRDWSIEPPPFGHLLFWKHYRLVPLFSSFCIALVLGIMGARALHGSVDRLEFVTTLEARLLPLAILLFSASGALNLMLLAAPWQARRKIAAIDVFDPDYAEHQLRRVTKR